MVEEVATLPATVNSPDLRNPKKPKQEAAHNRRDMNGDSVFPDDQTAAISFNTLGVIGSLTRRGEPDWRRLIPLRV